MKMKAQRRDHSLNKAKKLARKQLRKQLSITALIELFICSLLLLLVCKDEGIGFTALILSTPILPAVLLIAVLFSLFILWLADKNRCLNNAYDKISAVNSKTLAEKILVPGKLTKIEQIYTKEYRDFFLGLADDREAEFYAVLGEKDHLIELFVQLKGSKKLRSLGVITKEEFSSYCEIAEDASKT